MAVEAIRQYALFPDESGALARQLKEAIKAHENNDLKRAMALVEDVQRQAAENRQVGAIASLYQGIWLSKEPFSTDAIDVFRRLDIEYSWVKDPKIQEAIAIGLDLVGVNLLAQATKSQNLNDAYNAINHCSSFLERFSSSSSKRIASLLDNTAKIRDFCIFLKDQIFSKIDDNARSAYTGTVSESANIDAIRKNLLQLKFQLESVIGREATSAEFARIASSSESAPDQGIIPHAKIRTSRADPRNERAAVSEPRQISKAREEITKPSLKLPSLPEGYEWPTKRFENSPEYRKRGGLVAYLERVWRPLIEIGFAERRVVKHLDPSVLSGIRAYTRKSGSGKGNILPEHLRLPSIREARERRIKFQLESVVQNPDRARLLAKQLSHPRI